VNIAPWEQVTTHDATTHMTTVAGGIGDLFLRTKLNLAGDDGGNISFALDPYVKAPTAPKGVGNGAVEAGLIAPLTVNLPQNWQLSFDPEVDLLANAIGAGRHANTSAVLSFGYPLTKELTGAFEVWGDANFDPTGTVTQTSFDLALAWIPTKAPNLQLDGGVNFGLNKVTPGAQLYAGVTRRF
jgi:Putative MetA-pathway of phenol degradation